MSTYSDNLHHRLSVDSARDATDSSDDETQNTHNRNKLRVRRNIDEVIFLFFYFLGTFFLEADILMLFLLSLQYEQEIERLQSSVDLLKLKLEQAEHQLDGSGDPNSSTSLVDLEDTENDNMKNIIARYDRPYVFLVRILSQS